MRVTGWINRFLANARKHQNDQVCGELTPREHRQAEEQIKTAQPECFPDKIQALKDNKASLQEEYFTKDYTEALWGTP